MVSRDFQALSVKRAARARALAGRYPASREALAFYAELASFQAQLAEHLDPSHKVKSLLAHREALVDLIQAKGPEALRKTARTLDAVGCRDALQAYLSETESTSPPSFFARVLLQPWAAAATHNAPSEPPNRCPHCGHPPQAGCLDPHGDGAALSLACSLCLKEWPFPRGQCPACGLTDHHRIAYYSAAGFEQVEVQACHSCRQYLQVVNRARDAQAVPDVDEIAALPLDVWAQGQGFRKLCLNLVGM